MRNKSILTDQQPRGKNADSHRDVRCEYQVLVGRAGVGIRFRPVLRLLQSLTLLERLMLLAIQVVTSFIVSVGVDLHQKEELEKACRLESRRIGNCNCLHLMLFSAQID